MPHKYIDVSTFQGTIDWARVKPQIDGAILRAGYGAGNIDAQFVRNITECNRLGIPVGVYWFSYATNAAKALNEAKFVLEAVKPYRLELPIAYDWEYDSVNYCRRQGVEPTPVLANKLAETFCRHIEANGYYAMVYTNGDFLNRYFTDIRAFDLWYAAWPANPDPAQPPRTCGIWQYGGSKIDGINGSVDTNAAYRDYPTIIRNAGLNHLSPLPTEDELAEAWAERLGLLNNIGEPVTLQDVIKMLYRLHGKEEQ